MIFKISSKDADEECKMRSKSKNVRFTSSNDANEVDELFESLRSRYQGKIKFIFDSVQLMHKKCQKVNFRRFGSYIDSADLIKKNKKSEK